MSFHYQYVQGQGQQYAPNPPPNFGSESWMTNPFNLTPGNTGTPFLNDVGTGQQSSYREQTYTLPGAGAMSYHEWSG